ncbi:tetratricopeptide repeat protein [Methanoregula sp.]|uniref:tetratricopeptide repeat protein n=1 Tax=Methanoregula sp. TaxID=2052170 RepID=UPI0023733AA1|nr:tetratricopeptide repeat protein [Methanoregula sp.]MDD1687169.1 tetratricopeptide repeat protein [Methanoregula sp.]
MLDYSLFGEDDPSDIEFYYPDLFTRYTQENQKFERELNKNPDNAYLWRFKARALLFLLQFDEAIGCINRFLVLEPDEELNSEIWHEKAIANLFLHRYETALKCYNKSIELDPYNLELLYRKGNMCTNLEWLDEAKECYNQIIRLEPNPPEIIFEIKRISNSMNAIYDMSTRLEYDTKFNELYEWIENFV